MFAVVVAKRVDSTTSDSSHRENPQKNRTTTTATSHAGTITMTQQVRCLRNFVSCLYLSFFCSRIDDLSMSDCFQIVANGYLETVYVL